MKVLLAGGSGVLGQLTCKALADEGHEVVRLGRGAGNEVRADLLNHDAVLRAVDGLRFDAVIHGATALHGKSMTRHQDLYATDALRTTGTVNLLEAAQRTGARRFVAESMIFGYGYGDHGGALLAEDTAAFGPQGANAALERHIGALRTKELLTLGTEGIEGVALRFGLFYGAGVTQALVVPMLRKRALPVIADHGQALSWVDVNDAARAIATAVRNGRAGQAYNVTDDTPVSFGAHVRAVAEAFGTPRPMTLPRWMLRAAPLAHTIMGADLRLDNSRAKAELGWQPTYADSLQGVRALARADGVLAA